MAFILTETSPCPYLSHKKSAYLATDIPFIDPDLTTQLSQAGFRRSQTVFYRPACDDCQACISVRIRIADFKPSKSFRRTSEKNKDLRYHDDGLTFDSGHFDLFSDYVQARHQDGIMADMSEQDYQMMILYSSAETYLHSLYHHDTGQLYGSCITDIFHDGLSAVYSYFNINDQKRSIGTYIILSLIERCQNLNLPYLYLGYWIANSPKMAYKARFKPLEYYYKGAWHATPPPSTPVSEPMPR